MRVLLLLAALGGAGAFAQPAQYVRSREVLLEPRTTGAADEIHAWISTDLTTTWMPVALDRVGESTYCFIADADGTFDFYFVAAGPHGAADDPPQTGAPAHVRLVVDTRPPLVQFRELSVQGPPADATLYGRVAVIDDSMTTLRLFTRASAAAGWQDAGALVTREGRFALPLRTAAAESLDVCVVARDAAENTARDEWLGLRLESAPASAPLAAADVADDAPAPPPAGVAAVEDPAAPPTAAAVAAPGADAALARLRETARDFAEQGRHALALARLDEALQAAPGDPELLIAAGRSALELGQYDLAAERFAGALQSAPQSAAALEGAALVAAAQRRYPLARDTLQRLLAVQPIARNWLNMGDVEFRLGRSEQAAAAWRRALSAADADAAIRSGAQRRLRTLAGSAGSGR